MSKKTIAKMLAAVCVMGASLTMMVGCFPRENTLKIWVWNDYMPDHIVSDFEEYYKAETGGKFKVDVQYFDDNEVMYSTLTKKKSDYDLVMPSDYMIEKMYKNNLLLALDMDLIPNAAGLDKAVTNPLKTYNSAADASKTYAIPYVYGTNGVMYNPNKLSVSEMEKLEGKNWAPLWEIKGNNRVTMKEVGRDAYATAMLNANKDALLAQKDLGVTQHQTLLNDLINNVDATRIAQAKTSLVNQRRGTGNTIMREIDDGKTDMAIDDRTASAIGLYWSCDAGYMWLEEEATNIWYYVPEEGSNWWVDAWVMPKYAKNTTAAHAFLDYMLEKDVAKECMEYAGATTAVIDAADELHGEWEEDEEFFEGTDLGWKEMFLETMFPAKYDVLDRCAIFRYVGETKISGKAADAAIDEMWIEVRTASLS